MADLEQYSDVYREEQGNKQAITCSLWNIFKKAEIVSIC